MSFELTVEMFRAVAPRAAKPEAWVKMLNNILPLWQIDTQDRVFMFLAQCSHESAGFTIFSENLNYSASGLTKIFGKYFGPGKRNPNNYARQPEKIANVVYANRIGNGNTSSGDGWRYRGRGIIQLTGKANYKEFANDINMPLEDVIDYVSEMNGSVEAACWFWKKRGLNQYADRGDIRGSTKRINGGYNGIAHREDLWRKIRHHGETTNATGVNVDVARNLGIGDRGNDVAAVQRALGLTADGVFGPNTHRAVKNFQRENRLTVDGIVGPMTAKEMGL